MVTEHDSPTPLGWPEAAIEDFCRRWKVNELSLYGSALREDFGPGSDIDLLVRFAPEAEWTLFDHARMELELVELLGRDVDLTTASSIESSPNWIRKQEILDSARVVYAA